MNRKILLEYDEKDISDLSRQQYKSEKNRLEGPDK